MKKGKLPAGTQVQAHCVYNFEILCTCITKTGAAVTTIGRLHADPGVKVGAQ